MLLKEVFPWESQLVEITKAPAFMHFDFDQSKQGDKYFKDHYLEPLNELSIDMRIRNIDFDVWTT